MKKGVRVGIVAGVAALFLTVASLQSPEPELQDNSEFMQPESENDCDPSYPDFCIPRYASDLDCADVQYQDFTVYQPDKHGFDRDNDGIGCES